MSDRRFFMDWMWMVTLGESAGFLIPAVVGVSTTRLGVVAVPLLMLAGAVEGALLGWAQWWALRRRIPELSARRWVVGTALAAAVAYGIGLLPSTFVPVWGRWTFAAQVLVGVALALVLLCSIGFAQWLELRRWVSRARSWIAITAVAWCLGLATFLLIATPLWFERQSTAAAVAVGAVAGLAMAGMMAAITGAAMTVLSRRRLEAGITARAVRAG